MEDKFEYQGQCHFLKTDYSDGWTPNSFGKPTYGINVIIKVQGHFEVKVIPESNCLNFYSEAGGRLRPNPFLLNYVFYNRLFFVVDPLFFYL